MYSVLHTHLAGQMVPRYLQSRAQEELLDSIYCSTTSLFLMSPISPLKLHLFNYLRRPVTTPLSRNEVA